ncbi:epsin-2 isoform X5 [Pseudorca crassidens]|uniref:epsin-2 isoform X5 n=1 Tax=Pseudorca crassidens TaxID=82174 RepID=UPI00352EC061
MTTSSIRRQMKNIVNNYSEAEIKVREATSNDPWGPSSSLMTEIADLTYNVVAFSEIMSMVWKRLNDHGKNWRHVYKALTLLDYLIKTGSERVAQQCRENIFAIQTLKDFQYVDRDGKDQGVNVREKAKQLVALLKDEERLKAERAQALKTKERMAQVATGMGSNQLTFGRGSSQPNLSTSYSEQEYGKAGGSPASYHGSTSPRVSSELEQARPQTSGEEELQLQLALAMSREVAEQDVRPAVDGRCRTLMGKMGQTDGPARCSSLLLSYGEDAEERLRRGDDLRLQMALEESRRDTVKFPKKKEHGSHPQQTTLLDLLDALPGAGPAAPKAEPWGPSASASHTNPWGAPAAPGSTSDPWPSFAKAASPPAQNSGTTSPDPFESQPATVASSKPSGTRKTPESFLGPNAALVNLDSLVARPAPPAQSLNPFLAPGAAAASAPVNPFQVNQPQPLTLNQLRGSPVLGSSTSFGPGPAVEPVAVASVTSAASHPALGAGGSSLPPLGPAAVNMVGSLGVPPSAAQATGTTNPFLL